MGDFPGGSVVKIPCFHCRAEEVGGVVCSIPCWGTKIPQATWDSKNKQTKVWDFVH